MTKTQQIRISVLAACVVIAIYVVHAYATHFWYREPQYTLGVNTPGDIRNVTLELTPRGVVEFGVGGEATYEDPRWHLPTAIDVTFANSTKEKFRGHIETAFGHNFDGKIILHVLPEGNSYQIFVEAKDRKQMVKRTQPVLMTKVP